MPAPQCGSDARRRLRRLPVLQARRPARGRGDAAVLRRHLRQRGVAARRRRRREGGHVVITEAEHISVLNIAKYLEKNGFKVTHAPIDLYGRVSPKKLRAQITDDTILVSVGWASNEIGTVQP